MGTEKSSARSEASFFELRDLIQDDAFEVELDLLKVTEGKYDYYLLLVNEVALVCFYTNQIPISLSGRKNHSLNSRWLEHLPKSFQNRTRERGRDVFDNEKKDKRN